MRIRLDQRRTQMPMVGGMFVLLLCLFLVENAWAGGVFTHAQGRLEWGVQHS
jgi:hypothetical protein